MLQHKLVCLVTDKICSFRNFTGPTARRPYRRRKQHQRRREKTIFPLACSRRRTRRWESNPRRALEKVMLRKRADLDSKEREEARRSNLTPPRSVASCLLLPFSTSLLFPPFLSDKYVPLHLSNWHIWLYCFLGSLLLVIMLSSSQASCSFSTSIVTHASIGY